MKEQQKKQQLANQNNQKEKEKEKNNVTIDPIQQLYQEQDLKVALNNQSQLIKSGASLPKRRYRQNYLSYSEPFELQALLDDAYWQHKKSLLAYDWKEMLRLTNLNKLYSNGKFEECDIHEFLDFKEKVESATRQNVDKYL